MAHFFILLSILLSAFALAIALPIHPHFDSLATVLNLLGITIASTGFIVGGYFAYKAVAVYRHLRELEKEIEIVTNMKTKLTNEVNSVLNTKNEIFTDFTVIAETIESMLEEIDRTLISIEKDINSDENSTRQFILKKARKLVFRTRSKLFYMRYIPEENRDRYQQLLMRLGDRRDLEKLKKVIDNSSESEEIRKKAKMAYEKIQQRFEQKTDSS